VIFIYYTNTQAFFYIREFTGSIENCTVDSEPAKLKSYNTKTDRVAKVYMLKHCILVAKQEWDILTTKKRGETPLSFFRI
jgi:hypothetical protein